ncbi:MAG: NUDIX hydrolase [Crocinitomicaceae bacterium]|nr:NUDIX hydrolase [Crocinitomicaceae bacterium]
MPYIPHIFLTVDIILTRQFNSKTEVLLIQRLNEPFRNNWALPGGFVDKGEDLEPAAKRELLEETSISIKSLTQFKTYGKPGRDPRGDMVSVVFYAEVAANVIAQAADDAKDVRWFPMDDLPELAFDHAKILREFILKC